MSRRTGTSTLELNSSLSWVSSSHEDFCFETFNYDYDRTTSVRGQLGARFETRSGFFLDGQLNHEFSGDGDVTLSSGSESDALETRGRGSWVHTETGYGKASAKAGPIAALWANFGDTNGIGARLGVRF